MAEGRCLGTGCMCYTRMPRVDCDKGFADLLPGRVKLMTETLVLDHVVEGSLDLLDITQNWPSLRKIIFNQCSTHARQWMASASIPTFVEISSPCGVVKSVTDYFENDISDKTTTSVDTVTFKVNNRGIVTEYDFTWGVDVSNTTAVSYSVDIAMDREGLIVTIVLPISFIIVGSLLLYIKWRRSAPSRLTLDYYLRKDTTKARNSPPPETASLVDAPAFVFDNIGLRSAAVTSQLGHAGML